MTPASRTPALRTFADARRWTLIGTELLSDAVAALSDTGYAAPSALPGWTRAHVAAHVAANAEALGNLVHWAATGEPTPMYASPEERAEGIERGRALPANQLTAWLRRSADTLEARMDALGEERWRQEVVTAQGRTVPATELPWMRAREVCVHAVDLATDVSFADLPADFLTALCDEVAARRATAPGPAVLLRTPDAGHVWELPGDGEPAEVVGPPHTLAAYLTGRDTAPRTPDGSPAPLLGAWL
ncbi:MULTISPECIES: maleylpyruvate isomerase family mycothiol-dependent enzyme [unclassified Streptomyces]|uniref:maleylpyruvate isomerase family mycothiol-dependent enzyme n=1 Tax=unclassified Streptomyces TaxID=2593676 RepID=UPI001661574A|nr:MULTISPECIES: maleylpyruvate isomerase family mycothiol-dependent enzyme [unclassified Streptomyces]MBD0710918.1 maleylpyruvate isomerase [Streptomyces sp. CBMA291]MBD0717337.1 maleylpyruvate isomerase [Streptomyces sp. CBMA370]